MMEGMGGSYPVERGLYSFRNEHDACGVGLVANLNGRREHATVSRGIAVLTRLMHRGASGSDERTGDGAGILLQLPDEFFRRQLPVELPPPGEYGVAMVFGGEGAEARLAEVVAEEGGRVLHWRRVPVEASCIGESARRSCPVIRQCFIERGTIPAERLEWKLYVIRRRLEKELGEAVYYPSFSSRTIVYKGLLLGTQLEEFYPELKEPSVTSALALVHQRYSTNTFPTWRLAHPYRYLAHNGEINTLRGNLNQLRGHEPFLACEALGEELPKLLPLIDPGQNDSASLDNMLELLVAAGRSLPHAMLMLMPQAWGADYYMGRDVRGFFDYHSALMEPWDGPAAVAFTDGINAGAILDRNGLRPARFTVTDEQLFVLASEAGVLDIPEERIVRKGRLKPGQVLWLDLEHGRLVLDAEVKNSIARRRPYRRWAAENKIEINGLFDSVMPAQVDGGLVERQRRFGWSQEDIERIVRPMAQEGHEPLGAMGNDTPPAVLSRRPQSFFNYFHQMFAQVTNPPIDPIREKLVMSLTTYIGNQGNLLSDEGQRASLIKLKRPVLTAEDILRIEQTHETHVSAQVLRLGWQGDLGAAVERLQALALAAVRSGHNILVLSDQALAEEELPLSALLGTAAVNRALTEAGLRPPVGLIVQSGEVREVEHFALLLAFGATAVHPYLALETVSDLAARGKLGGVAAAAASENYIKAVDQGLLKIMSKMGISTLRSYRSAQIFEALGLDETLVARYFPGTASRIGGLGLAELAREAQEQRAEARRLSAAGTLSAGGQYRACASGEQHQWDAQAVRLLRQAAQSGDAAQYAEFERYVDGRTPATLRALLEFQGGEPVPLEEVEPASELVKHFVSGAMSLGSLSPEAHEAIGIAMNALGGMSNCGEGGEAPEREVPGTQGEVRTSAIRQVASARFGVTIGYLAKAKELQIKMAQGAKPGEGGRLPGGKVDETVARMRHATPGVTLISPPPHHDIYSIEDFAQLIYDLRCANPQARISVKLVSECGVGTVAAGVAKGHADVILISGYDGGTGAAPLSSIRYAGMPWELGVAEAQQTLALNGLRGRVRLQVDGQLKTARDVMIGALLGAEEFGFGTALLVCLGCSVCRQCGANCCPAGIATQDPVRRRGFRGRPEYIVNYLTLLAESLRRLLAQLGYRRLEDAVGQVRHLRMGRHAAEFYKSARLDLSRLLEPAAGTVLHGTGETVAQPRCYDEAHLLAACAPALEAGRPVLIEGTVDNTDRTVGARLSFEIVRRYGEQGLPPATVRIALCGTAGQSFGAFLAPGVELTLTGEANDGLGKGLSGGRIVVRPNARARFTASENVIAGNVVGYGGTAGKIFLCGQAGERFAARNSGVTAVVEGIGDHGCEYMTGGRVLVLGPTGVNFGAGMTGGVAYVFDESNDFDLRCNLGTIDIESVAAGSPEEAEIQALLQEHFQATGSRRALDLLEGWAELRSRFVAVRGMTA